MVIGMEVWKVINAAPYDIFVSSGHIRSFRLGLDQILIHLSQLYLSCYLSESGLYNPMARHIPL
jgi:hypothetical protein